MTGYLLLAAHSSPEGSAHQNFKLVPQFLNDKNILKRGGNCLPTPTLREAVGTGRRAMGRYLLLWLLGIPIPVLILIWFLGGIH